MHYAAYNQYSTESSIGLGDDAVVSFDSRVARDAWVQASPALATRAITHREALRLAGRLRRLYWRNGGYLANMHLVTNDNVHFVRAF